MSWSGTVEIHQVVLEFLTYRLRYQLRQLEIVNLLFTDDIELGTLGSPEVSLVFVVLGKIYNEHQAVRNILGVNVAPRPGLGFTGVGVNGHLGTFVEL